MEAKLERHGDVTVVHLRGKLDLEKNQVFREVALSKFVHQKVIFCLRDLRFVGSSGIQTFFRTLQEIHSLNKHGVKIAGLKPDFLRVLQYTVVSGLEVHESSDVAVQSFVTGIPGGLALSPAVVETADNAEADQTADVPTDAVAASVSERNS